MKKGIFFIIFILTFLIPILFIFNPFANIEITGSKLEIKEINITAISISTFRFDWYTDVPSEGGVILCKGDSFCLYEEENKGFVMEHSVIVTNLEIGTTYDYKVMSTDKKGYQAIFEGKITVKVDR